MEQYLKDLLDRAREACGYSYAKYSEYSVGAAVLTGNGVYLGANIENASSNLGICAERVAIAHAFMNKARDIKAVAVCCRDAEKDGKVDLNETMPCGGCRQWLLELAPNALIVTNGSDKVYTVEQLLPIGFQLPKS